MRRQQPPLACAREPKLGPQEHAGGRVCPGNGSSNHRQRQCAATTLREVGNRETKRGHCRWRARSRAPNAFDRQESRRYEQLPMFPATLDRKTTPANERTVIDARPKVEVSDG